MHPEVQKLLQVQKVDKDLVKLRRAFDSIPKERARREKDLARYQAALAESEASLRQAEVDQRTAETSIKQGDDELKNLEARLNTVKNNAEYQATLLQMESVRKDRAEQEDKGLELIEAIEARKATVESATAALAEEQKVFDEFIAEGEKFQTEKREELERMESERKTLIADVQLDVADRYARIVEARDGVAVVPVEGEYCTGCYTQIPPNMMVKVLAGSQVIQCNNCQRFLYSKG